MIALEIVVDFAWDFPAFVEFEWRELPASVGDLARWKRTSPFSLKLLRGD